MSKIKAKYEIKFCIGYHCAKKGYTELLKEFERVLGIDVGGITEDSRFSLDVSGCVGSCRQALAVTINTQMYRDVQVEDVKNIIDSYR